MARRAAMLTVALLASSSMVVDVAPATAQSTSPLVAFTSDRDGNSEVYVVAADGKTAPLNITRHPAADDSPTWSPDGRQFAFVSDRSGNRDIWVWPQETPAPYNLSSSPADEYDPAWSPDGSQVAYRGTDGIYLIEVATRRVTRLTVPDPAGVDFAMAAFDGQPQWSPDGATIAFVREYLGPSPTARTTRFFTVAADGAGPPVLVASGGWDVAGLAWAASGTSLVWGEQGAHGLSGVLRRWDLAASSASDITIPLAFTHYRQPALSSDGGSLAFEAYNLTQERGDIYAWRLDGPSVPVRLTTDPASDTDPAWQPSFHSVGMADTATGLWTLRQGVKDTRYYYGDPGDVPFMGDWNCDGVDTPGLFRQSDGFAYLRNHNTEGVADIRFFFGNPDDVPLAGDFDGDGCDTVSIYRPAEQRFYIINRLGSNDGGLGAADFSFDFGNPGDQPVVGDWDGDGRDEVGLHRESSGFFYWRNTLTTGVADGQIFFGDPGDRFVAWDWDGDGVATPAVFRPAAGIVYFRNSLTEGVADSLFFFGGPSSYPVAGDFALP